MYSELVFVTKWTLTGNKNQTQSKDHAPHSEGKHFLKLLYIITSTLKLFPKDIVFFFGMICFMMLLQAKK